MISKFPFGSQAQAEEDLATNPTATTAEEAKRATNAADAADAGGKEQRIPNKRNLL